jgi:DNA-binding IclR family transcriptional regulator
MTSEKIMHDANVADATAFVRHFMVVEYARSFRRQVTTHDLIARFGCSRASAYRYIHALRDLGVLGQNNWPVRPTPARSQTLEHC